MGAGHDPLCRLVLHVVGEERLGTIRTHNFNSNPLADLRRLARAIVVRMAHQDY